MLGRRASRLAPPRHRRGAWLGIPPPRHAHRPCPVVRSRCGRARCPHRAAAPSARCVAWHRAHAESFACRGSVRGTVRGRAAHPARCHDRAAITHAHYPGGAMGTSRPTAITPAIFASRLGIVRKIRIARHARRHYARPRRVRIARGGSPPRATPGRAKKESPRTRRGLSVVNRKADEG